MSAQDDHFFPARAGQFLEAIAQIDLFRRKEFHVESAHGSKSLRLAKDERSRRPFGQAAQQIPQNDHAIRHKMPSIKPHGAAAGQAAARFNLLGDISEQFRRRVRIGIDKDKPIALRGGGAVRYDERRFLLDLAVGLWNLLSQLTKWAAGAFIFCEAKAFRTVGGFNMDLFATEEIDLSKRLKKLARASGKKMVILRRHPLVTSSRKVRLYSTGQVARLLRKVILRPRQTLTNRDECAYWYDGRR